MATLFLRRLSGYFVRAGVRRLPLSAAVAGACLIAGAAWPAPGRLSAASLTAHAVTGHTTSAARYAAEIRRTEYGVPHILAHDYAGLGYGYGYAFAQDNLCTMADRVVTLRGERSAYFGAAGDSGDTLGASTTNLNSDTYYQGLRKAGVVQRLLARPAPLGPTRQARQLVDGYVAGYNRYLSDTGVAHLPDPTCRGQSWVTPITALDVWTLVYDLDTMTGMSAFKEASSAATPPPRSWTARPPPAAGAAIPTRSNQGSSGRATTRG
jgi:acyl-homoserine-lactone acylase